MLRPYQMHNHLLSLHRPSCGLDELRIEHLLSRIVDVAPDAVRIGMKVRVRFETASDEVALPVFQPAA